ncbi:MAG TPA: hypothetical protein VLG49_03110 [Rhabdochlamydiaceae bacterium]|nr:hypothetical protein [Rhabdochlamydiaceae bacterium]
MCAHHVSGLSIPNVFQKLILSNAGATDLQQAIAGAEAGHVQAHVRCRRLQR